MPILKQDQTMCPNPTKLPGNLQIVIRSSRKGVCIEDQVGKFQMIGSERIGNRYLIGNPINAAISLKITQEIGLVLCTEAEPFEYKNLKYKVLSAKNYKEIRLCENAAYGLEFDKKYGNDPENKSMEACKRLVKLELEGLEDVCFIGLYPQKEKQAIRFYYN